MSRKLIGEVQVDFTKIISDYNDGIIKRLDNININKDKTTSVPLIDIYDPYHVTLKEDKSGSIENINIDNIDNTQVISFDLIYNFMDFLNHNVDISIIDGTVKISDDLYSTTMTQTLPTLENYTLKAFPYSVDEIYRDSCTKARYLKTYEKSMRSFACGYVSDINAVLKYSNVTQKLKVLILITSKRVQIKNKEDIISIADQLVPTLEDLKFRIVTEEK